MSTKIPFPPSYLLLIIDALTYVDYIRYLCIISQRNFTRVSVHFHVKTFLLNLVTSSSVGGAPRDSYASHNDILPKKPTDTRGEAWHAGSGEAVRAD